MGGVSAVLVPRREDVPILVQQLFLPSALLGVEALAAPLPQPVDGFRCGGGGWGLRRLGGTRSSWGRSGGPHGYRRSSLRWSGSSCWGRPPLLASPAGLAGGRSAGSRGRWGR